MRKRLCLVGQSENAAEHFIRTEGVRDLLVLQNAQGRLCVESVHRMDARAAGKKAEQARHAERAAEGQHGEQRCVRRYFQGRGDGARMPCERLLRMRDELWPLGGARCREQEKRRIGVPARRMGQRIRLEGVESDAGPGRFHRARPDDRDRLERGHGGGIEIAQDRGKIDGAEARLQHEHSGAGEADDMRDVRRPVPGIHRRDDGAEARGGKQQREPFHAVDEPHSDDIALADAVPRQPAGCLSDLAREIFARDGDAVEMEENVVRLALSDQVGKRQTCGVRVHPGSYVSCAIGFGWRIMSNPPRCEGGMSLTVKRQTARAWPRRAWR